MISTLLDDIVNRVKSSAGNTIDASQLKSLLHSALQKADIVTREEFDAQTAVLLRTRERVQHLEAQLSSIEEQLKHQR